MSKTSNDPNKFGLKRYIPQNVRTIIRREAGYGCVVCGALFCDYEHIEPEFHNAKIHDPNAMTLLCSGCHAKVTGGRKSKKRVWKAKVNPAAKIKGYVNELLEPSEHPKILLGNNEIELTSVVLSVHGKPLLWFEEPEFPDEPILINAIFYDHTGKPIAFINRNQFTGVLGEHDICSIGTRVEIRPKPRKIALILNSKGDEPIVIERLNMGYLHQSIEIKPDKSLLLKSGKSIFSIATSKISNCGFGFTLGDIPSTRRIGIESFIVSKVNLALQIAFSKNDICTNYGYLCGWVVRNLIINKRYEVSAVIRTDEHDKNCVDSITGEFIGYLDRSGKQYGIKMPEAEYDTYEPIWVHPLDKLSRFIRLDGSVDLCHRILDVPQKLHRLS